MDTKNKTYNPSKEKKKSSRKTNKKRREKEEAISEEGFSDGSQYEDIGDGPYQSPEMDSKNKTYKPSKEKKKSSRKTNKKRREKEEAISEEKFSDGSQYEDTGDGPYQPSEMDMKNKTYKPSKEKKKSSRKTNKKRREKEEAISEEKFSVGSQYEDTDDGPYQPPEMDSKNKTYKPSKEKKKSSRKTNKKRREKEEAISEEKFSDGSQYEDTGDGPYQSPEMDTKNKTYKPSKEKKTYSRKTNKKCREKEEAISEEEFSYGSQYEDTDDGPYQPLEMDKKNKPSKEKKKSSRKTNKKRREKEEATSEEGFSDGSPYEDTEDDKITVRQPRHRYKVPGNDDPFKIIKALNQQYGENIDNLTLNIERKPTDGLDKTRLKLIWS
ncbi:DNA ligase 1-like [Diaphorina citri]|uniref:DNA ligase 1-like n=1 Tax=Diaphorina citri TaxID=121845 RepID=A0A1S3DGD1_DIACI|nr:DNA ligase 1-like [Diaphorina citri]